MEKHRYPGFADADWELRDDDHDGIYERKILFGYTSDDGVSGTAIATGCFDGEARFKLACCGIDLDDFPHATSSDTPDRTGIIRLAAMRAGASMQEVIYFGDASWDAAACRTLQIPMIGIGRRIGELQKLGVAHVFPGFLDQDAILAAIAALSERMV